jgi:MFS family permease
MICNPFCNDAGGQKDKPDGAFISRRVLTSSRNFSWLCVGGVISMVGDQFNIIALPLLVLRMTGDPLALGLVFMLIGVPRAIFILVGGAVVDHYSPQRVLMLTKYVNTVLLGFLGALVLAQRLELWMLYGLAAGLGLSTAFSIPSATAMLPHALPADRLHAANGAMLGLRQASIFLGPILAGALIAVSERGGSGEINDRGLGLAFVINALTVAVSAWTLSRVVPIVHEPAPKAAVSAAGVARLALGGLRFCWGDRALRVFLFYGVAVAFFVSGPLQLAVPVLAVRLQTPAALGVLMGAHGGGALLGMALGMKSTWRVGGLGSTILALDCLAGVLFAPMGYVDSVWEGGALLLTIGAMGGFQQVALFTWIQQRVPLDMMGRAMSLFMFVVVGVTPVSASLTGWALRLLSLPQAFALSGALLVATVLVAWLATPMRGVTDARRAGDAAQEA